MFYIIQISFCMPIKFCYLFQFKWHNHCLMIMILMVHVDILYTNRDDVISIIFGDGSVNESVHISLVSRKVLTYAHFPGLIIITANLHSQKCPSLNDKWYGLSQLMWWNFPKCDMEGQVDELELTIILGFYFSVLDLSSI